MKKLEESILPREDRKFIFFGGKGGVGKSSLAAATAFWLAAKGFKTLLASTDIQKSQNDIFQRDIGSEETEIPEVGKLWVVNVDPKESIRKHQLEVLKRIETLKDLSAEKISESEIRFLKEYWEKNPILPCETASYNVFIHYMNTDRYDAVVFDTAPGYHNLEMVNYPWRYVYNLEMAIAAKKEIVDLTGKVAELKLLERLRDESYSAIKKLASDQTVYFVVTHPEMLPVYEVKRIQDGLTPYGIKVRGIFINSVLPKEYCINDFFLKRRTLQEKYINLVKKEFNDIPVVEVPLLETEVVGLENVKKLAHLIYDSSRG
ncbi:MAG: ArsA family ATPase [Candidatus Bathyarchaeia archaeon]